MAKKKRSTAKDTAVERVLTGREIKRFVALLKAREEYPDRNIKIDLPNGFIESFENQPAFRGWLNYHVTWDINREYPWKVVSRKESLVAEWHRELIRLIPVIEADGTIVSAEEYEKKSAAAKQN
jgi:hypothetical protein